MTSPLKSEKLRNFGRRHAGKLLLLQAILLLGLGYYWASATRGSHEVQPASRRDTTGVSREADAPSAWTCSMHPQIRQPNPGDCPICGMDLIPVAKSSGGMRTLTISPEARALMSIETAPVERRYVSHAIRMVGKVDYDETKLGYITAWVSGRLDRLYVDYTGVQVNKGDHMAYVYSEELYSAQQELIQTVQFSQERSRPSDIGGVNLLESAREKLRLLGLTEAQIKEIEEQKTPTTHLTIYSPVSGIVIEKLKQEGERVKLGDRIYTIADLSLVWVHLDAYESDLPWIRYGQDVTITTEAYPGDEFEGRIAFIQPVLNDKTRTVKVRVNVPNVDGKLKPEMFVRATVEPKVAAGGRVMDPSLAGKWIGPMHPEIVRDEPGDCPICGMPLVRAESMGYVTPETDEQPPPLVIPYLAALPTGTRAVVYVELPPIHSAVEPAFQTLSAVVEGGKLDEIREAFAAFTRMLDRPYDQPGTQYAKHLWSGAADRLGARALEGQRAKSVADAERIFGQVEALMNEVREQFAPLGQPTFEGREIVLGPRAGDFYLVRHGLEEGELVVRQGNFKIDSEIQIQAKPSMMTPEGGGGSSGHDHAGSGAKKAGAGEHADHPQTLPADFAQDVHALHAAYQEVSAAIETADLGKITPAFEQFGQALSEVEPSQLTGHPRSVWKELSMLLANDVVEGRDAQQIDEADRVYLLLKNHMRRLDEQLNLPMQHEPVVEQMVVAAAFQGELARLWEGYLAVGEALANDDFATARQAVVQFESVVTTVDATSLTDAAAESLWHKEHANLTRLVDQLKRVEDIQALREKFRPLSDEIGVLAKAFGFGAAGPVYELHCPMAFEGQGAVWYQADQEVRNPYYGATMLKCADRVQQVIHDEPAVAPEQPQDHSNH
ncbi:MAG: efflux RND transporter periplasmic adaptor subunit [Pirellulaceae bacterium]